MAAGSGAGGAGVNFCVGKTFGGAGGGLVITAPMAGGSEPSTARAGGGEGLYVASGTGGLCAGLGAAGADWATESRYEVPEDAVFQLPEETAYDFLGPEEAAGAGAGAGA